MSRLRILAAVALSVLPISVGRATVDHTHWLVTRVQGTPAAYQMYLQEQPTGRHIQRAYRALQRKVAPPELGRSLPSAMRLAGTYLCPPSDKSPFCVDRRARLGAPETGASGSGLSGESSDTGGGSGGFGSQY